MAIRKAVQEDLDAVKAIYKKIFQYQNEGKLLVGWVEGVYPTDETAEKAFKNGDLFVMEEDGKILASARINQHQEEEYRAADWKYKGVPDQEVMVIHTLAVDPECSGKGYGSAMVKFYEDYAMEHGCRYLRMDTGEVNQTARRMYKKLGYWEADIIPCDFNSIPDWKMVCLEKRLNCYKKSGKSY